MKPNLQNYLLKELQENLRQKEESAIEGICKFIKDFKSEMIRKVNGEESINLPTEVEVVAGGHDEEKHIWTITSVIPPQNGMPTRFMCYNDSGDIFHASISGITYGLGEIVEALQDLFNV